MNYSGNLSSFRPRVMLKEEFILIPDVSYSPVESESISNKWNNFFVNSSGSETDMDSNDSGNKSVQASYASSSCSSTSFEGTKVDDAQLPQELNTDNSDNSPTVKDISLAPQFPKRNSDGLCQITLSSIPSHQHQVKRGVKPLGFSQRQDQMEPSRLDGINEDNLAVSPIRHSHSASSRLNVEDCDRMDKLKISSGENGMLKSVKGTVRGYKNMVRRYSASFNSKGHVIPTEQTTNDEDSNRIIIYTTSMTAVRSTTDACSYVKKVFQNRGIPFEERDVFIHKEHQKEMQTRLGMGNALTFPHVVINGNHVGGLKEIDELNESGKLLTLVSGFQCSFNSKECERCGGRRFINCIACGGSKTSRKHRIIREICSLRCTSCNENGLVSCPKCSAAEAS